MDEKYGMLGNYTKEDIVNALKIIKDVCMSNDCENCPFKSSGKESHCIINFGAPGDWRIKTEKDWRAFEEED